MKINVGVPGPSGAIASAITTAAAVTTTAVAVAALADKLPESPSLRSHVAPSLANTAHVLQHVECDSEAGHPSIAGFRQRHETFFNIPIHFRYFFSHFYSFFSHRSERNAPSEAVPPISLVIVKVRDLPNMDADEGASGGGTDPFVRIRFKEIETGKVFTCMCCIFIVVIAACSRYHSLSLQIINTHARTTKFLHKFEKETKVMLDADDADFMEYFVFDKVLPICLSHDTHRLLTSCTTHTCFPPQQSPLQLPLPCCSCCTNTIIFTPY